MGTDHGESGVGGCAASVGGARRCRSLVGTRQPLPPPPGRAVSSRPVGLSARRRINLKMSGCRVFVGHLSSRARERDVEKFFKGYGRIREIHLKNGFGFVEFEDHRDADDAIYELNGKELCDERVTIEHARARRGRGRFPQRFSYYQSQSGSSGSNLDAV